MNEVERLRQWMKENGYTTKKLADRIGFTYDGVYQALNVRGKEGRFSGDSAGRENSVGSCGGTSLAS
jgi:hypothetical protein